MRRALLVTAAVTLALGGCSTEEPSEAPTATEAPSATAPDDVGSSDGDADGRAADGAGADGADEGDPGDDGDGSGATDAAGGVAELTFVRCESDELSVDRPASWVVEEGEQVPPCRIFHPEPVDDVEGENLHHAVRLYIDPVAFEDAVDSPLSEEVVREEATVDGRDAVIIERRSEGEALLPAGERSYSYTVDLDGRILVGTTSSVGDTDYERDKAVLDRMMRTITVHADG